MNNINFFHFKIHLYQIDVPISFEMDMFGHCWQIMAFIILEDKQRYESLLMY